MLRIRLSETGKKHDRKFRIVVGERRSKRDSKVVDTLGHWDPRNNILVVDKEKYAQWVQKGAQPAHSVQKLVK